MIISCVNSQHVCIITLKCKVETPVSHIYSFSYAAFVQQKKGDYVFILCHGNRITLAVYKIFCFFNVLQKQLWILTDFVDT
jgi:hypothetical protein